MGTDIWLVLRFWGTLFFVGSIAYPLTKVLFGQRGYHELDPRIREDDNKKAGRATRSPDVYRGGVWFDDGYFFSKAVGMATVTFGVFVLGSLKILPFGMISIAVSMGCVFILGLLCTVLNTELRIQNTEEYKKKDSKHALFTIQRVREWAKKITLIALEEGIFLGLLIFWAFIKGHEPSIHGLEKFMDFGFTKSILNGGFFPPKDMWYNGSTINYYYFGHATLAVVTKLSGLDLAVTFNLILATLFSLCFTMAGSIGAQLAWLNFQFTNPKSQVAQHKEHRWIIKWLRIAMNGILTGFFVTLAGNMQTIYAFTRGYTGDNVKPFWELFWKIPFGQQGFVGHVGEIWTNLQQGLNTYWYANATRFIPFTIHEFPSYSFVVSDIHGHVLSIPYVLLAIAMLIQLFARDSLVKRIGRTNTIFLQESLAFAKHVFYGFLCGVLFMTNALDGPIYLGLFIILLVFFRGKGEVLSIKRKVLIAALCVISAGITAFPFIRSFKPFVTGIGVNCPPAFLANQKIGPFLFETIDKCQHSPIWMWWLLWGFFVFCGGGWIVSKVKSEKLKVKSAPVFSPSEIVLVVFFFVSLGLLIFPEFLYFKDIYPAHFRSNTMFKLGYQAFMMLSIVSVYGILEVLKRGTHRVFITIFFILLIPQVFLVSIFPLFSVRSYFNGLRTYENLDGMGWMRRQYPDDYSAIQWLNSEVGSPTSPLRRQSGYGASETRLRGATSVVEFTLVEADGDSYTDYARMSAFTGIPTVIGWPVHEWLWRGSYDVVAPRRADVARIYETTSIDEAKTLLRKYSVTHVIVGTLERQKYPNLYESKFLELGTKVFESGLTAVYSLKL